ncbi:MAG: hypothetical protein JW940_36345 [Polyangiaceae bacterium]|nr:hypothetical protein [Polyangiaceae bacterium]
MRRRKRTLPACLTVALCTAAVTSCVHAPPLTAAQRAIRIEQADPAVIARLKDDCTPVGAVEFVPDADAARRRADEQQAQVVLKVMWINGDKGFNAQFWQCPAAHAELRRDPSTRSEG